MNPRYRRLATLALVPAVAAGVCLLVLANLAVSYSIDRVGGGVTIVYASVNPSIPSFLVGLPKPKIYVTDAAGRRVEGVIINLFAGLPNAEVRYLGSTAGNGGSAPLTPAILSRVRSAITPEWRSALNGLRGFKTALLAFVDVLVPAGGNALKVYSFVKTIPLNLWALYTGYRLTAVKIVVNTSAAKPLETLRPAKPAGGAGVAPKEVLGSRYSSILNNCVIRFCTKSGCEIYCSKWVLERAYAHLTDRLIPIVMVRWARGYDTLPEYMLSAALAFRFSANTLDWLKIYASAKIVGEPHTLMLQWEFFKNNFYISYARTFINKRWLKSSVSNPGAVLFRDDAIVAIGTYGSVLLGMYRKYVASGFCGLGSCSKYRPTDVTANITILDLNLRKSGGEWVGKCNYTIDDNLSDGKGLQSLWALAMRHSRPAGLEVGKGNVGYTYVVIHSSGIDLGIDVGDLAALAGGSPTKALRWLKDFPVYVGVEWESGININGAIIVAAATASSELYMFMTNYTCKDRVCVGSECLPLKTAYYDIAIRPPS